MVRHEAVGEEEGSVEAKSGGQLGHEAEPFLVTQKDRLAVDATIRDVKDGVWEVSPEGTGHHTPYD
jgi:hypothetical protein